VSAPVAPCPSGPEWKVDHAALRAAHSWLLPLDECIQDAVFHAEGDVGIHTRLVVESLVASPAWRALPEETRQEVFAAAILHDVAKPEVTRRLPDGRVSSKGHAERGASRARHILWEAGVDPHTRERICSFVRWHLLPFVFLKRDDPERLAILASLGGSNRLLAMVAEADGRGRECEDQESILESVELYRVFCEEQGCLDQAYAFPSDHARFLYFRSTGRHPAAPGFADFRGEVTLLSGLPASGKSTWAREHAGERPIVSLDRLRQELGVHPAKAQGKVVQAAREEARTYLRAQRDFIWDATSLTRGLRKLFINLCADYRFRVRIVALETPAQALYARNDARKLPVPAEVISSMLRSWEPPSISECHTLEVVAGQAPSSPPLPKPTKAAGRVSPGE
jgi:predicted kinase